MHPGLGLGLGLPPPPKKNALDKNYKLEDCDEKRKLPIKVAFAQKDASNHSPLKFRYRLLIRAISQYCPVYCNMVKDNLCTDGMQLFDKKLTKALFARD